MFPQRSGVYQHLEDFRIRANEVLNFTDSLKILEDMPKERAELSRKQLENTGWIHKAMITLEDKMEPYIMFDRL